MMNLKDHFKKKVLVIGISSYIGKNIADFLFSKNFEIIGSFNKNKPFSNQNFKLIKLDLTNKNSLRKIPNDVNIIINCACIKKKYYEDLKKITHNNIISSYLLIDYINSELNIEKLIFTSSMSVFGYPKIKKVTINTDILNPTLYGNLKYLEEKIFISNAKNYSVFCLRLPGILDKKSKYSLIPRLYEDISKNKLIKISNHNEKYNNILSVNDLSKFVYILCKYKTNYIKVSFPISATRPIKLIDIVMFIKNYLKSASKIQIINSNDICRFISNKYIEKKFKFKTQTVLETLKEYIKNKEN